MYLNKDDTNKHLILSTRSEIVNIFNKKPSINLINIQKTSLKINVLNGFGKEIEQDCWV